VGRDLQGLAKSKGWDVCHLQVSKSSFQAFFECMSRHRRLMGRAGLSLDRERVIDIG
jgi:hypothetical protein